MNPMREVVKDLKENLIESLNFLQYNKKLLVGLILFFAVLFISLIVYPLSIPFPKPLGEYKSLLPPSPEHPLGTDKFGRDMTPVLLYGIQMSLYIGFIAGIIGTLIGIVIGFVSGYRGGVTDHILRSVIDVFLVIPLWPLLVILMVFIRNIPVFGMAIILGVFSWPGAARTIRAQMLSLKEREFVNLAKISDMSMFEILFKEILPNMIPYLAIIFVNRIIGAMFAEVGLEVIGLGPTNATTLGFIFHYAILNVAVLKGWWWWLVPSTISLVWVFSSLYIITLGLDEIANPRLKRITGL